MVRVDWDFEEDFGDDSCGMYTVGASWSWKMSAGLLGDSLLYISVRPQLLFEVIVDDATPAEPFWDKRSDSSDPIPTYVL